MCNVISKREIWKIMIKKGFRQMPFSFNFGGFDPNVFGGGTGGGFTPPQRPKKERKPRKAIGNAFTRTLINLAVTLVVGLAYFYVELPALNTSDR